MEEVSVVTIKDIDDLILIIDELVKAIIVGNNACRAKLYPIFSSQMLEVFPKVVSSYLRPEFVEVRSDMQYWTKQLQRILDAMQQKDQFLLIDILRYETKENLLLYRKMLVELEK